MALVRETEINSTYSLRGINDREKLIKKEVQRIAAPQLKVRT